MKRKIKIISILIIVVTIFFSSFCFATEVNTTNTTNGKYHNPAAIAVPEKDINLKIENLTRGTEVYVLLPEALLRHNMEKFVSNNLENPYEIQARVAREIKDYMDKNDYLGYIEYFIESGFEVEPNEIELRHYCFCFGESELIDYREYNGSKYIQVKLHLNDNNEFKMIFKDYLEKYDCSGIKFMIDEFGTYSYIDVASYPLTTNRESSNISEYNINYEFKPTEDFESIENATKITYLIIYIILTILVLIILIILIKRHIKKKEEIEARKFWKKRLTKEEKKEEKKRLKEEKKEAKKNKKKK